jgi:peptide/nickel transport system substrate-binding protein
MMVAQMAQASASTGNETPEEGATSHPRGTSVRSRKRIAAIAMAAAMTLAACGSGNGDRGSSAVDTVTLATAVPPTTFAAANAGWANEAPYIQAVYDSLLRESSDAEIEPWLATDWSYNDDKTVLTMELRNDVTFTDGQPFNAEVAAQNVLRFRDGTSPHAAYLEFVTAATATDEYTLEITLAQPDPALLIHLAQNAGTQASPASFYTDDAQTNPVGSGPFILDTDRTVVGSTYVFTRNPDYWAPEEQHFETLVMKVYNDAQTTLDAIRAGQVDFAGVLDASASDQIEAAGYTLQSNELDWAGLILFDRQGQLNPALADVRVRQAIAHAIDRDAMLEELSGGHGTVTGQVFSEHTPAYDESLDDRYPYDPDMAEELLADAGYDDGLTLRMPLIQIGVDATFDRIAQYLEEAGITVDYVPTPLANAAPEVLGGYYPASYFFVQQDPTAWQTVTLAIAPDAPFNVFHTTDPKVDALVETIQTGSEEEADAAEAQLNEFVVEQAWFVPFFRREAIAAVSKDIHVELQIDNAYPSLQNIRPTY